MRRELEQIAVPDEEAAEQRAWRVVAAAFETREPAERRSMLPRLALVAAVIAALVAAALSPAGMAVLDEIREVVGVENARPALFSLPAEGRLLVTSDDGAWIVENDGSRRRLGSYRDASWSPFGRFVVATGANEVAALEPDGDVRWVLARPGARSPRWAGSETDTRIAYVDRSGIRVVAGDGTGDRLLVASATDALAWRPGTDFVLAHAGRDGRIVIRDTETGRVTGRSGPGDRPVALSWSDDGRRLLVVSPRSVRLLDEHGRAIRVLRAAVDAAVFRPGSHEVVLARRAGQAAEVLTWPRGRSVFRGTGVFDDLAWSPDGRWLLVGWPTADQWVFVSREGRIRAVANVGEQFQSRAPAQTQGWCCAG